MQKVNNDRYRVFKVSLHFSKCDSFIRPFKCTWTFVKCHKSIYFTLIPTRKNCETNALEYNCSNRSVSEKNLLSPSVSSWWALLILAIVQSASAINSRVKEVCALLIICPVATSIYVFYTIYVVVVWETVETLVFELDRSINCIVWNR